MIVSLQLIVFAFGAVGALAVGLLLKASHWKWIWMVFFGTLTIVGGVLTVVTYEKPITATDIARELAGGNNFCFLEPIIINPKTLTDAVPIRIVNNGTNPIPRLQFFISPYWIHGDNKNYSEVYTSIMPGSMPLDCSVGAYPIGLVTTEGYRSLMLKPGRYRVEFTTTINTGWVETLTIEQSFSDLVGVVDVNFVGKKPYRSPRPTGYVEW